MRISFHGAAKTVTGSSHLVESGGLRILIDCGMHQGGREAEELNRGPWPYEPASIDYLILTHAHIDHSGLVPRLVREGFRGRILATPATIDLLAAMLADAAHIQEMEAEWQSRKRQRAGLPPVEPLYTVADAEGCLVHTRPLAYGQPLDLGHGVTMSLHDAGHILGSAIVVLEADGRRVVFSGDLGNRGTPIIRDPERLTEADVVVMESTYGDRLHPGKEDKLKELAAVIDGTLARGGNLIIPAFAVGRTQELLYDIGMLVETGQLPPVKVYIDSPLAITATEIFRRHPECFNEETRRLLASGEDPFKLPGVHYTRTSDESKALNRLDGGAIIISASGMADAGRILHHLKHNLWRPEATVLFVGFQAQGTLGRRILDGEKRLHILGEEIAVKARVASIEAFSAHADQAGLLDWLGAFGQDGRRPNRVFLVHGEAAAIDVLAGAVGDRLGYPVTVPEPHESFRV